MEKNQLLQLVLLSSTNSSWGSLVLRADYYLFGCGSAKGTVVLWYTFGFHAAVLLLSLALLHELLTKPSWSSRSYSGDISWDISICTADCNHRTWLPRSRAELTHRLFFFLVNSAEGICASAGTVRWLAKVAALAAGCISLVSLRRAPPIAAAAARGTDAPWNHRHVWETFTSSQGQWRSSYQGVLLILGFTAEIRVKRPQPWPEGTPSS